MKPLLERDVDRILYNACRRRDIECIKVASIANRGLPDRLLIGPGQRIGFIEVKRENTDITELQRQMLVKLRAAGVWNYVLHGRFTRDETIAHVERVLDAYYQQREF